MSKPATKIPYVFTDYITTPREDYERLTRERDEARARVKVLEEALREIAAQKLYDEMGQFDDMLVDWTNGYDACVNRARKALEEGR